MGCVTVGLHHKLCHTLGGSFGLPHAELHTVMLPHALAYNAAAAPEAMARIAAALQATSAPAGMFDLAAGHGAATSLAAIGMREADLDRAADLAMQAQYPNPRPLELGRPARVAAASLGRRSPGLRDEAPGCRRAQAVSRFTPFSSQA